MQRYALTLVLGVTLAIVASIAAMARQGARTTTSASGPASPSSLMGTVRDAGGKPLNGVPVSARATDQTFTTSATATSQTVVLGHEGFVSPGSVVGAEVGCFHGTTTCTGQLTMSHNGTTIAQRGYTIAPDSGGFQNMELNSTGQNDLKSNGVFNLIAVTVTTAQTGGPTTSWVIHLARWVWH